MSASRSWLLLRSAASEASSSSSSAVPACLALPPPTLRRQLASTPVLLGKKSSPPPTDPMRRSGMRKFVEDLRRRDDDGATTARFGQGSRAFSPAAPKPFASLDRWPPPKTYVGKGHHKPVGTQTNLRRKPELRAVSSEEDFKKWTQVLPGGGRTLNDTLKHKGFKKVRHFEGGRSGGAPSWIFDKEKTRAYKGEEETDEPKHNKSAAPAPREFPKPSKRKQREIRELAELDEEDNMGDWVRAKPPRRETQERRVSFADRRSEFHPFPPFIPRVGPLTLRSSALSEGGASAAPVSTDGHLSRRTQLSDLFNDIDADERDARRQPTSRHRG